MSHGDTSCQNVGTDSTGQKLSSFRAAGLTSKKQWILPDWLITILKIFSPFIFLCIVVPFIMSAYQIKSPYKPALILFLLFAGFYGADLLSSLVHLTFVDNAYSDTEFTVDENDYMLVPVIYGYSSCHHYFPSNWTDVDDSTAVLTMAFIALFFIVFIELMVPYPELRFFIYSVYIFSILTPLSHKYVHEIYHKRYTPSCIKYLFDCNLLLNHDLHRKHHENDVYDWGLLSGISDPLFNCFVRTGCGQMSVCPIELMAENYRIYEKKYQTDVVKMRFTGDIEGRIKCKRDGHSFIIVEGNH